MSCVLATLRALEGENIWEKLHLSELLPNYLAASLFPIGSLDELWIPIGPLFQFLYNFQAWYNYCINEPVVDMARDVINNFDAGKSISRAI
jgi:hypothetical protein